MCRNVLQARVGSVVPLWFQSHLRLPDIEIFYIHIEILRFNSNECRS